jgi:tetratricopeptide (TPR) repeat protein
VDEKLTARAKLLYEINNNSPLFLRTAYHYLQNGNTQFTLSILENGIKNFPEHPLAFILLGKAYYQLGNTDLVTAFIRKASDLLNSLNTYKFYKEELNLPDKSISTIDSSRGNYFLNRSDEIESQEVNKVNIAIEDRLEEIAKAMMSTKFERKDDIKISDAEVENNPDKSKLASETLAKIYLVQGQKKEAIEIYNLLIQRNPEVKEYYLQKIEEIQNQN